MSKRFLPAVFAGILFGCREDEPASTNKGEKKIYATSSEYSGGVPAAAIAADHPHAEAVANSCSLSRWIDGIKTVENSIACITNEDVVEETSGLINWVSIWGEVKDNRVIICTKNVAAPYKFATYTALPETIPKDAHKWCRFIHKQLKIRDKLTKDFNRCFNQTPPMTFRGITRADWENDLSVGGSEAENTNRVEFITTRECLTQSDKDDSKNCQGEIDVSPPSPESVAAVSDGCYEPHGNDEQGPLYVSMYFVRHGESEWNEKSASMGEASLNEDESLTDAKLTALGTMQARRLSEYIENKGDTTDDWKILNDIMTGANSGRKVVYATSNLRRASLTFLRAFQHLITPELKIDKLHILSALQEPAPNIDSNSLSKPGKPPALTLASCPILSHLEALERSQFFDSTCNRGDELTNRNRLTDNRLLDDFCVWMRNMANVAVTDFVIAGHSMFLRGFFQRYLKWGIVRPNRLERMLESTIHTVGNGSLIKIKIELNNPNNNLHICNIQKRSTQLLYGGVHGRNIFKHFLYGMDADE